MDAASNSIIDDSIKTTPRESELQSTMNLYEPLIKNNESKFVSFKREIDKSRSTLDSSNHEAVNSYNALIVRYNRLLEAQKAYVNIYK
jgi:hypothetical protein